MPSKDINSHIIPQHHLKQFANDKGCIFTYPDPDKHTDAQCISKGGGSVIKRTASRPGYYSQKIEAVLSQKFENDGSKIATKILGEQTITTDERDFFATYLASFIYRVPYTENAFRKMSPKLIENMKSIDAFMEFRNRPDVSVFSEADYFRVLDDPIQAEINIRQVWENSIESDHHQIYEALLSRVWWIAKAIGDEYFITSDNPLSFSTANGIGDRNIQMTFPLSQKMALVFDGDRVPSTNSKIEYHPAGRLIHNQVELINQRTADHSTQLYSPRLDVNVQSLLEYRISIFEPIKRRILFS